MWNYIAQAILVVKFSATFTRAVQREIRMVLRGLFRYDLYRVARSPLR